MDTKGSQVGAIMDKDRAKGMLWGLIVGYATAVAMMDIRGGQLGRRLRHHRRGLWADRRSVLRVRGDTRKVGYGSQGLQEGRKARGRFRGSHVQGR